jgi:hypothetical protein
MPPGVAIIASVEISWRVRQMMMRARSLLNMNCRTENIVLQKHTVAKERGGVAKERGGVPGLPLPHTMNGEEVVEERYAL